MLNTFFLAFSKTRSATAYYTAKMASVVISENIYSLVMDTSALEVFNATHYTQKLRGVLHTTM